MDTQLLVSCRDIIPRFTGKTYEGEGLDLDINSGEIVSIIGPDYCGKSEWLAALGGITPPAQGRLHLLGHDLESVSREHWKQIRMNLAYLDAEVAIMSAANARQNVMLPARYHRMPAETTSLESVCELLNQLGVTDQLSLPAYIRPDQRYRVAIARALILDPAALLLDTPFDNLGSHTRREFQSFLIDRVRDRNMSLITVTHDIDFALEHSDRILFATLQGIHQFDTADDMRRSDLYAVRNFLSNCRIT